MATSQLTSNASFSKATEVAKNTPVWEEQAEFNRFGIISMTLLVVGCLGGIAVGMGAIEYVWSLVMIVIPTMITLSLLLAVSPMRYIIYSAALCVVIDISLLLYFMIV